MAILVLSDLGALADLILELSCALTDFADQYPPDHPVHAFARQTRILARDLTRDPDILIKGPRCKDRPSRRRRRRRPTRTKNKSGHESSVESTPANTKRFMSRGITSLASWE